MFILKGILRAESQENILIYLLMRGSGYAKEIADFYSVPNNPVQKQLARLEADSVVVSELIGKVRNYQMNPRYAFVEPLKEMLKMAAAAYPPEIKKALLIQRTRPRQAGKPLISVRGRP